MLERILSLNTMYVLILLSTATALSICFTAIMLTVRKLNKDAKTRKIRRRVPSYEPPVTHRMALSSKIMAIIATFLLSCDALLLVTCYEAHIRTIPFQNLTLEQLPEKIQCTHIEDKVPEDLRGNIIIFYKYNCPDCESIYRNLVQHTINEKDIYFSASNSEQGKKLRETYPITDVPCGIYVHKDGSFTNYTLYMPSNAQSGVMFDKEAMNRLIQLKNEQR